MVCIHIWYFLALLLADRLVSIYCFQALQSTTLCYCAEYIGKSVDVSTPARRWTVQVGRYTKWRFHLHVFPVYGICQAICSFPCLL